MRLVIKVGTSTLAHATGKLNIRLTSELCRVISDLKNAGNEVVLVSSGAIGMGVGKLSLKKRPTDIPTKQAAAAVGQCELMYVYDKFFAEYGALKKQIENTDKTRFERVTSEGVYALKAEKRALDDEKKRLGIEIGKAENELKKLEETKQSIVETTVYGPEQVQTYDTVKYYAQGDGQWLIAADAPFTVLSIVDGIKTITNEEGNEIEIKTSQLKVEIGQVDNKVIKNIQYGDKVLEIEVKPFK